jgi:hypothetical protein
MYDPDYKYCPSCGDEFQPEIKECAECGVLLLGGQEMKSRQSKPGRDSVTVHRELQPGDDLVVVRHGPMAEMKAYKKILGGSGVSALLAGDESSCGKGCCAGNFDLVVRREEAPGAIQIIEDEIRRTSVIDVEHEVQGDSFFDPLAKDNTCPACGYRFSGGVVCPDCGLCF